MKISVYFLPMILTISFPVFATEHIESDDNQLLLASCQALIANSASITPAPCIYYIQGFLAGARVTNPTYADKQDKLNRVWPSFLEKGYRSSTPGRGRIPPRRLTRACVPEGASEVSIIKRLSDPPTHPIDTLKLLREQVNSALKIEYPC